LEVLERSRNGNQWVHPDKNEKGQSVVEKSHESREYMLTYRQKIETDRLKAKECGAGDNPKSKIGIWKGLATAVNQRWQGGLQPIYNQI
jgi:hypothetical protein